LGGQTIEKTNLISFSGSDSGIIRGFCRLFQAGTNDTTIGTGARTSAKAGTGTETGTGTGTKTGTGTSTL